MNKIPLFTFRTFFFLKFKKNTSEELFKTKKDLEASAFSHLKFHKQEFTTKNIMQLRKSILFRFDEVDFGRLLKSQISR